MSMYKFSRTGLSSPSPCLSPHHPQPKDLPQHHCCSHFHFLHSPHRLHHHCLYHHHPQPKDLPQPHCCSHFHFLHSPHRLHHHRHHCCDVHVHAGGGDGDDGGGDGCLHFAICFPCLSLLGPCHLPYWSSFASVPSMKV